VTVHQFRPIYHTKIFTVVQCIYANYVIWGDGSSRLVNNFLTLRLDPSTERGKFLFGGGRIGQCNVGLMYRKNVALQYGCSIPTAE